MSALAALTLRTFSGTLRDADLFCFPTFYQNENQPVNLIEAMAFGLPVVTTRWRTRSAKLDSDWRTPMRALAIAAARLPNTNQSIG